MVDVLSGSTILIVLLICVGAVVSALVAVGITVLAIYLIRRAVGPNRAVLQSGIPAKATIMGMRQTGIMVNDQPQISMLLEVEPPNGPPYQAQAKAVIPMVNIPQFQPGARVSVKIHPMDPNQVVLDIFQ